MQRIAVIFDHTQRPETTGIYCRRALGELARASRIAEVEHFLPSELDRIPANRFDLFLYVDDGLVEHLRDDLRPAVWWAIDTHLGFDRCLNIAKQADLTFAAQRNGAEQLQAAGIRGAAWLPLACDPEIHARKQAPLEYDIAFIGNLVPGPRLELLRLLQESFPKTFIGRGYFEEMAAIYSGSKAVFNRSIRDDVNMRVFEGLCSGSLLITNDLSENGQRNLFQDGMHCATYRDEEELLDKLRYYLTHDDVRERIAAAGRDEVVRRHTYRHRMETILDAVVRERQSYSVAVHSNGSVKNKVAKDRTYFEFDRPDVLELVPTSANRVLDIGCGAGRLGAAIKQRQSAHVTGIEMDSTAAELARKSLDDVRQGDVQKDAIDFPEHSFDCVVCADVLEHLEAPHLVMEKVHRWLAPGGCLITSIPNVRNQSVVKSLLAGNWTYEAAGLLDSDHVRFFTRRGIEKLLLQQGFAIQERRIVPGAGFAEWVNAGRPRRVEAGELQIETALVADAEEFFAYQYVFRSTPIELESKLTSIVLVTHNQLAYTRACIESLFRSTPEPFELIIVDNASTDGTDSYVETIGAKLIRNEDNLGFPAAVNQGIQAATGDAVLLLNNDTLLTTGWLERLWAALRADEKVGLVGPLTNCTSGVQRVDVAYDLASLDDFAWDWRRAHFGQVQTVPELTGFCLLIDRRVIDAVGLFDERFENGVYEDIDYCRRAREAGFDLAIAADAFVHHFGHKSYQAAGVDQDQLAVENEAKFREKWNLPKIEQVDRGAERRRESRTPRSLRWNDGFEPLRRILELMPDDAQQVLVFVQEDVDLMLCKELRRTFGARVVICPPRPLGETPFDQLPQESLDDHVGRFDVVIVPRLDQHREPRELLESAQRLLRPEGELICHARNVRSKDHVEALLRGTWSTGWWSPQLRFFTRRELEKLLFAANFRINGWLPVRGVGYGEWRSRRDSSSVKVGSIAMRGMPPRDLEELFTSEFVARASKQELPRYGPSRGSLEANAPASDSPWSLSALDLLSIRIAERKSSEQSARGGVTSIIIVTHNQWAYTKSCIESIRMRTTVPYEIVVVDNGSSDQTLPWLQSQPDLQLIRNSENRGFPAAANQGIRAAQGSNILLLNNDTIVTTGWLRRQLEVLYSDQMIGLVGPVSNNVSGEQQVELYYPSLDQLDGAAWDWGWDHDQQRQETDRLVGFCLLTKREVFDRVGLLDERFGIGNFEDDDFCRRAREAGYRAVIARDAFVHHFGSVTFQASGVDFAGVLKENRRKYLEKWNGEAKHGANGRNGTPVETARAPAVAAEADRRPPDVLTAPGSRPQFLFDVDDEGALLLKPNDVHLSACLIVRDNENSIRPCLESLKPWVDEIVVVDTGSQDATPRICEELGARVFHWAWKDSFSAARNVSFDLARGEWIFWMDSDDTLPEECGRKLRNLALGSHSENVHGYVMQVHCPGDDPHDVTIVDHVKLIRNRSDLRFEFRIHEQILPAIRRADGDVAFTDIYVVHSGSDRSLKGRQRKLERDFHLLDLDLKERPDHPFVLFNLGMTHADAGQYEQAVQFLQRCIEVSGPEESHLRKAFALLVGSLIQLGRNQEATVACERGLEIFPKDKELLFRQAMLYHQSGRLSDAAETYERLLTEHAERHFASIDSGIVSHKARHNLAVVYEDMGYLHHAEAQWRAMTDEAPDYFPGWRGLGENLVTQADPSKMSAFIRCVSQRPELQGIGHYVEGQLALKRGNIGLARAKFEQAVEFEPRDTLAHHALCRLIFERSGPKEAVSVLRNLLVVDRADAAAWHNLGLAYMDHEEWGKAAECFQTSLKLRPHSLQTKDLLETCLSVPGDVIGGVEVGEGSGGLDASFLLVEEGSMKSVADEESK